MKKWFKEHFTSKKIISCILTGVIILLVLLIVFFENKDKKRMEYKTSDVSLVETDENLNKSWTINQDGNLVGNNLFNLTSDDVVIQGTSSNFQVSSQHLIITNVDINQQEIRINLNNLGLSNYDTVYFKAFGHGADNLSLWSEPSNRLGLISNQHIINGVDAFLTSNTYWIASYPDAIQESYDLYFMFSLTPIEEWEPYGVWYSDSNYESIETQLDITLGNINPLSVNNISSNTLVLNSIDVTSQLDGSIFLSDLNGGLGFYNYDFDAYSSFNDNGVNEFNLVSFFNRTYSIYGCTAFVSLSHSADDYLNISLYRDNQLILVMNDLDSETTQDYMQQYGNQEIQFNKIVISGKYTSGFSNRYGTNYIVDNNNFSFGYQQGYKDSSNYYDSQLSNLTRENSNLTNELNNINSQYETLDTTYNNLLDQYNLIAQNDYTFSELFWSISAVPFGVLTSTFNVNVMGVNLALNYNRLVNIYGFIMAYKETF